MEQQVTTNLNRLEERMIRMRIAMLIALVPILVATVTGCATTPMPPPMTLAQVIELSKSGTPPADIITQLRETRTILQISGSQYAKLKSDGIDDSVLDYLQQSYVRAVETETRFRYQGHYWGGYGFGPGYPFRPYSGPWPYWYYW